MKKRTLWSVITVAVAVLVLGACGNKKSDDSVLKVGASPVPHAEILEHVKPLLEKEGVKLIKRLSQRTVWTIRCDRLCR